MKKNKILMLDWEKYKVRLFPAKTSSRLPNLLHVQGSSFARAGNTFIPFMISKASRKNSPPPKNRKKS